MHVRLRTGYPQDIILLNSNCSACIIWSVFGGRFGHLKAQNNPFSPGISIQTLGSQVCKLCINAMDFQCLKLKHLQNLLAHARHYGDHDCNRQTV